MFFLLVTTSSNSAKAAVTGDTKSSNISERGAVSTIENIETRESYFNTSKQLDLYSLSVFHYLLK